MRTRALPRGARLCEPQQHPLIRAVQQVRSAFCLATLLRVADPRSYGVAQCFSFRGAVRGCAPNWLTRLIFISTDGNHL
jgi:hypothetical protein